MISIIPFPLTGSTTDSTGSKEVKLPCIVSIIGNVRKVNDDDADDDQHNLITYC
jgi:hypothetical protein